MYLLEDQATRTHEHLDWSGVKQACQLERTTVRNGETTHEVAYVIMDVSRTQADAADLLEWWQGQVLPSLASKRN